jgi:methyl-accepting chemotaxis protein
MAGRHATVHPGVPRPGRTRPAGLQFRAEAPIKPNRFLRIGVARTLMTISTNPRFGAWRLRTRLAVGFGALLALMLCMALFAASRLVVIRDYNSALDERAYRLSLANQWLVQAKIAKASQAALGPDVESLSSKLAALIKAASEQQALNKATAARQAGIGELVTALQALSDELVRLQIADSATLQEANRQALWLLGALTVAGLVLGAVLSTIITRSITQPVGQAVQATERIAAGELFHEIRVDRNDELGLLLRSLSRMQDRLRGMLTSVRVASDSIDHATNDIAAGNADLSQRTETTASNLQQTASSMEQLTGTVRQSADSATTASRLATNAAQVAERGGKVVSNVVSTMEQINAGSKRITDIVGVIDGIAFQTNILALNAAVEAARAGEQGRGFAVVAAEVRTLAQRSATAAKEIKALIGASVDNVETGAQLVQDAGKTMNDIVVSVRKVNDIIAEITAAATEQSDGISQVGAAVTQLDHMTQQNAAMVEQSAAAAQSLKEQASSLAEAMSQFRLTS